MFYSQFEWVAGVESEEKIGISNDYCKAQSQCCCRISHLSSQGEKDDIQGGKGQRSRYSVKSFSSLLILILKKITVVYFSS